MTEEDILHLVNAGNEDGVIEEQQREMINNIFEFDDILVSEVMTHRKEVTAIDVEMEISQVVELARNEKYSRMPVYQENIDNVIGVLNAKDLLGLIGCPDIKAFRVRDLMREALFVPETAKCNDVMADMLRKKMQIPGRHPGCKKCPNLGTENCRCKQNSLCADGCEIPAEPSPAGSDLVSQITKLVLAELEKK